MATFPAPHLERRTFQTLPDEDDDEEDLEASPPPALAPQTFVAVGSRCRSLRPNWT